MANKLFQCELPWGQASPLSNSDITAQPMPEPFLSLYSQEDLVGKGFNNHFRKEKCTYSFLLTKVLELDGVSVQISPFNKPTNGVLEKWVLFVQTGGIYQEFWPS